MKTTFSQTTHVKKAGRSLLLVFLLVNFNACKIGGLVDKAKDAIDVFTNIGNNTNVILDETLNKLNGNVSNFQSILQESIGKVNSQTIKAQLQDILDKGIVTASTEIRCDIQFTGDYIISRIQALKASLNNTTPVALRPRVCTNLPSVIDMNLPANNRNTVMVTGYFLNQDASKYKLVLRKTNGSTSNQTSKLSTSSDFKLIINLGNNGIVLDQTSDKLILSWDNIVVTEIPITQRLPEPCRLIERVLTNLPRMVLYPELINCPANNKRGDKEFYGNGPCTTGSVTIFTRNNSTELWATSTVTMWECPDDLGLVKSDYTYAVKTKEVKLITVDAGWRIKRIKGATNDNFQNIDRVGDITEVVPGGGPVLNYNIHGDTGGSDIGASRVEISFAGVSVTLEELGDCIRN
jgi:hypothetical protein